MAAGGTLDEANFRYPGPKPNTKETAIVMLADASEAVARTLAMRVDEPTVELIEHDLAGLFRAAAAKFDERLASRRQRNNLVGVPGEDLALGARQVILIYAADRFKELRAEIVVKVFRKQMLRRG